MTGTKVRFDDCSHGSVDRSFYRLRGVVTGCAHVSRRKRQPPENKRRGDRTGACAFSRGGSVSTFCVQVLLTGDLAGQRDYLFGGSSRVWGFVRFGNWN